MPIKFYYEFLGKIDATISSYQQKFYSEQQQKQKEEEKKQNAADGENGNTHTHIYIGKLLKAN